MSLVYFTITITLSIGIVEICHLLSSLIGGHLHGSGCTLSLHNVTDWYVRMNFCHWFLSWCHCDAEKGEGGEERGGERWRGGMG